MRTRKAGTTHTGASPSTGKRGRPALMPEERMVHTAVVLPRALIARLKANGPLSTEIRARLERSFRQDVDWPLDEPHVLLVGDIVSGFDVVGPFPSGHDCIRWKQGKGAREYVQGQWYTLRCRNPGITRED